MKFGCHLDFMESPRRALELVCFVIDLDGRSNGLCPPPTFVILATRRIAFGGRALWWGPVARERYHFFIGTFPPRATRVMAEHSVTH